MYNLKRRAAFEKETAKDNLELPRVTSSDLTNPYMKNRTHSAYYGFCMALELVDNEIGKAVNDENNS